jgi:hypothetical protein
MKATAIIALFSFAPIAASTQVCACGGSRAPQAAASDAAAEGAEGGAGQSTTGGNAGAGGVGGGSVTAADAGRDIADAGYAVQATQLLDDMRGVGGQTDGPGTSGSWSTYSDRTFPWSEPPIFVADAGVLVPLDGTDFPAIDGGNGPMYVGGVQPYRRCFGGGETQWGVGFGMDFVDVPPDGGDVPMNDCDAGMIFDVHAAGNDSFIGLPFDASGWTGIQFWGKSLRGVAQPVTVNVDDDSTSPWGLPADAGACNVCIPGSAIGACSDAFQAVATLPTDWTQIRVPFASMHPQGWAGASRSAAPNVSKLFDLHFQIDPAGAPALAPFDVAVSYIELYK